MEIDREKMKKSLLLITLFSSFCLFSQRNKEVENVKGTAIISGDVSPNKAKILALNEAKVNALRSAGVDENINSYQMLFTSHIKNDYSQFFSSDIQSEMQGAVKSYELKGERMYCKNENEVVYEVVIDAKVIQYTTKPDLTFNASIDGIKAVYNSGGNLNFTVKPTRDCYLNIFNITDSDAGLLYPNSYEKQKELKKDVSYPFPTEKIDYSLGSGQKKSETNRLIFVFTKKEIPFVKMDKDQVTTNEQIFSWIYQIPPDERKVEYFTLTIVQ